VNDVDDAGHECALIMLDLERIEAERQALQPECDALNAKLCAINERRSSACERMGDSNHRLLEALKRRARS